MIHSINIIGAGKLGTTLGKLIIENNQVELRGVCNANIESARLAVNIFQQGQAYLNIQDMPEADLWMITTYDGYLLSVFQELVLHNKIKKNNIVFHCSGAQSSLLFSTQGQKEFYSASIHPAYSFGDLQQGLKNFHGTFCALEGDDQAKKVLKMLFVNLGANVYEITVQNKMLYHIAVYSPQTI